MSKPKMERRISILISYRLQHGEDESAADELYESFQKQFKKRYPEARLSDVCIHKEDVPEKS